MPSVLVAEHENAGKHINEKQAGNFEARRYGLTPPAFLAVMADHGDTPKQRNDGHRHRNGRNDQNDLDEGLEPRGRGSLGSPASPVLPRQWSLAATRRATPS